MTHAGPVRAGADTPARIEFATPAWFVMLGEVLAVLAVADECSDGTRFSEVYHRVPREVAGHGGPVGWSVVVQRGRLHYTPEPDLDADLVIEVDHDFALETLQEHGVGDEATSIERKAAVAAAGAAGRFRVRGDLRNSPKALIGLHDALAARTVQV